jgi:ankyrin repeat protein
MHSAQNGHSEAVNILLDKEANIHDAQNDDWTALTIAAHKRYVKIVELVLSKGASTYTKNKNCANALIIAKANGYKEIVTLLLNKAKDNISEKKVKPKIDNKSFLFINKKRKSHNHETDQNQKCIRI